MGVTVDHPHGWSIDRWSTYKLPLQKRCAVETAAGKSKRGGDTGPREVAKPKTRPEGRKKGKLNIADSFRGWLPSAPPTTGQREATQSCTDSLYVRSLLGKQMPPAKFYYLFQRFLFLLPKLNIVYSLGGFKTESVANKRCIVVCPNVDEPVETLVYDKCSRRPLLSKSCTNPKAAF